MSEILITGIEMPKEGEVLYLAITSGGVVGRSEKALNYIPQNAKARELPPHTKLTEQSSFWNMLHEICVKCNDSGDINRYPNRCIWCKIKEAYEKVYQTPVVVEATK